MKKITKKDKQQYISKKIQELEKIENVNDSPHLKFSDKIIKQLKKEFIENIIDDVEKENI